MGTDSFTYTASDGIVSSPPAAVTLTVEGNAPPSQPPVFNPTTYTYYVPQNSFNGSVFDPLVTATDQDGDTLAYSITGGTGAGLFAINAKSGGISVVDNTKLNYQTTATYTLTVQASDGKGGTATANVNINVQPDDRVIAGDDGTLEKPKYVTTPGQELEIKNPAQGVLVNDYSTQGRKVTVGTFGEPMLTEEGGVVRLDADGTFTYTPKNGFTGTDAFKYTAVDGISEDAATVYILVSTPVPAGENDTYYVYGAGRTVDPKNRDQGVLANDGPASISPGFTAVDVTKPEHAKEFSFNPADGTFTYVANPDWGGCDSFTYQIRYDDQVWEKLYTVKIMANGYVHGQPAKPGNKGRGGVALVGGGTVPVAALQFLIDHANDGNFVVLTNSSDTVGGDSVAHDIWALAGGKFDTDGIHKPAPQLASVETIAIRNKSDGNNLAFVQAVQNAAAIFITGGNQANYFRYWPGTLNGGANVRDAVNTALMNNNAAIGGTSAGMAVLGQVAYMALSSTADGGNLYSQQALADPTQPAVVGSLVKDFLQTPSPSLTNIVTETHFRPGDRDPQGRMGRLISFLADMKTGRPEVSGTPHDQAVQYGEAIDGGISLIFTAGGSLISAIYGRMLTWQLGGHKSLQTWANQMATRGWTPKQIWEAMRYGKRIPAPNMVNPANGATRYFHPITKRWVVVDNVTNDVLQVAGDGFLF